MDCRTTERRQKLVREYEIKPIAHVCLLPGQNKKSCTGDLLSEEYYCFFYTEKKTKKSGSFICGIHAAHDFLRLLQEPRLPRFNPLIGEEPYAENQQQQQGQKTDRMQQPMKQWDPVTKQLSNAIDLLIICWNILPGIVIAEIKITRPS